MEDCLTPRIPVGCVFLLVIAAPEVLLLRRQKFTTVTEANETIHGHEVDVRVPQSCAGEQSCFLLKLFGDNEVPYSNHHSEYGGQ